MNEDLLEFCDSCEFLHRANMKLSNEVHHLKGLLQTIAAQMEVIVIKIEGIK